MDTRQKIPRKIPTKQELAEALEVWTYVIKETGDWRPVAQHILSIFEPIIDESSEVVCCDCTAWEE